MGDPRFHAILKQLGDLHNRKSADYGTDDDPLANYREVEDMGGEAWQSAIYRMADKWCRIKTYCRTGKLANESFEESLFENIAHNINALILWRERCVDAAISTAMKTVPVPLPPAPETITTPEDIWPCGCYRMDGEVGGCNKCSGVRHG